MQQNIQQILMSTANYNGEALTVDYAVKIYNDAKHAYELTDELLMSDEDFDTLENYLKENNAIDYIAGSSDDIFAQTNGDKIPLVYPMLSIETIKQKQINTKDKFNAHFNRKYVNADKFTYAITPKYDGLAIQLVFDRGIFKCALTRGNRKEGVDVSDRLSHITSQLQFAQHNIKAIIGEVVISKSDFKEYFSHYKNERNAAAGLINSSKNKHNQELCKYLSFVPLKVVFENDEVDQVCSIVDIDTDKIEIIQTNQNSIAIFNDTKIAVTNKVLTTQFNTLYDIAVSILNSIDEYPVRCDGVVITNIDVDIASINNGLYSAYTAFKNIADEEITRIKSIDFRVKNNGALFPRAILEAKEIDGTTVSHVSLFNYKNMLDNGLFPGAVIKISKSGDIIPHVQEVIEPVYESQEFKDAYAISDITHTFNGVDLIAENVDTQFKRFTSGVCYAGLNDVGYALAKDLYTVGYTKITDLFNFDESKLYHLHKKHGITITNLTNEIKRRFTNIPLCDLVFLMRFNGIGAKNAKTIAKHICSVLSIETFGNKLNKYERELLKTAEYQQFLNDVYANMHNIDFTAKLKTESISADTVKICLTGSPKQFGFATKTEFINKLNSHLTIQFAETSVKDCDILIADDVNSTKSKTGQAKKLNKEIITYEQAIHKYFN